MDDGAEVEPWSAIPALVHFATYAWAPHDVSPETARALSAKISMAVANIDVQKYIVASGMDVPPGTDPETGTTNMAKWLLWEDPLLNHLSPQVCGLPLWLRSMKFGVVSIPRWN